MVYYAALLVATKIQIKEISEKISCFCLPDWVKLRGNTSQQIITAFAIHACHMHFIEDQFQHDLQVRGFLSAHYNSVFVCFMPCSYCVEMSIKNYYSLLRNTFEEKLVSYRNQSNAAYFFD